MANGSPTGGGPSANGADRSYWAWSELRRLVQERLTLDEFMALVGDEAEVVKSDFAYNMTRSHQVQLLLDYARREGKVEAILEWIRQANAAAYGEFESRLRQNAAQIAEAAGSVRELSRQIATVPQLREAVPDGFTATFGQARHRIGVIAMYKEVHDLLHTIERETFNGLLSEVRHFPIDPTATINLGRHATSLTISTTRMQEFAVRAEAERVPLWPRIRMAQTMLTFASTQLRDALGTGAKPKLEGAIETLRESVVVQQSQFNAELFEAAAYLELPSLVVTLGRVAGCLDEQSGATEAATPMRALQRTVNALEALSDNLDSLLMEHNQWQTLIDLLRSISPTRDGFMDLLTLSWPNLKMIVTSLRSTLTSSWLALMDAAATNMEAAMTARNPFQMQMYFGEIVELSGQRFYEVDVTLKNLCQDLRIVGEAIHALLEALEDGGRADGV